MKVKTMFMVAVVAIIAVAVTLRVKALRDAVGLPPPTNA